MFVANEGTTKTEMGKLLIQLLVQLQNAFSSADGHGNDLSTEKQSLDTVIKRVMKGVEGKEAVSNAMARAWANVKYRKIPKYPEYRSVRPAAMGSVANPISFAALEKPHAVPPMGAAPRAPCSG
jgi:hypothetical protein